MWGAVAGGALGAIAGAQGDKSSMSSVSGIRVAPETELEKQATKSLGGALGGFESIVNAGPGAQAATDAMGSNKSLQDMLKSFGAGGFLPTDQDRSTANTFAQQMFQPQRVQGDQNYQDQQQQAARLAAQLNRPVNDPIIQAKLGIERMRQQQSLDAQQGAFSAQTAMNMPQQRLGYTNQLADFNNNLASQAMSNRQALLSLGSNLREQDRSYRIATGEKYGNVEQSSGGGLAGAIKGGMAGVGMGAGAQKGLSEAWGGIKDMFKSAAPTDYMAAMAQGHGGSGPGNFGSAAAPAAMGVAQRQSSLAPAAPATYGGMFAAGQRSSYGDRNY